MKHTIAIVGAGISGLLTARVLAERGASVIVLEKSRGVGGRMATKRVGDAVVDQGAQFFTTKDPRFSSWVEAWGARGLAGRWPGSTHRWIGIPGMTAIGKHLATGLTIEREHKVTAARRHACGCWELDIEEHGILRAERLVLTAPVPQSLAILDAGGVILDETLKSRLQAIRYHPCLALLVVLDGASNVPVEGISPESGPLRWVGDNVKKGISPQVPAAVTLHASADFSARHYGLPETEVSALLLEAARPWLAGRNVVSSALHRWKFSEPRSEFGEPCVWLPELTLGFAGDAFGGPRIEGAALSGLAMGERVASHLLH
ncbi:MAG: FAD-dependent oxidoreductase [Opitutaceae bacterium]|nr:FAD-dependent oxidoreductase [Opitutaceae bacterium]